MTKRLKVTVDGKAYDVTVEMLDESAEVGMPPVAPPHPPATFPVTPVAAPAPVSPAPTAAARPGDVRSTLAGKVVSIDVKPDQQVSEGQQVMTLEAMKMNTYIYAPKTGRVSAILVRPGDAVEEGAPLLTIA
jgi:biotin carboxyl carrier protein